MPGFKDSGPSDRVEAIEQKCDGYGCYLVYKDTGEALPHQNRMPSGEPFEIAGDPWAHLDWINSQDGDPHEIQHTHEEQRAPLADKWREMQKRWPAPWERTPRP